MAVLADGRTRLGELSGPLYAPTMRVTLVQPYLILSFLLTLTLATIYYLAATPAEAAGASLLGLAAGGMLFGMTRAQARLAAEQRAARVAAEASESRFRALVEGSIQGLYITGLDLRIRYANAAVARILGFDGPEGLIGRRTLEFYGLEEGHRVEGYTHARIRGEPAPTRYEVQAVRRDGAAVWLELLVSMVVQDGERLIQTTLIDNTERRAAEERRGRSEARAHAVIEASAEGIVIADRQGQIVSVNAKAEELFGYRRDEIEGQPLETLLPERLHRTYIAHRSAYFAAPQIRPTGKGMELVARRKNGTEFPVEIGLSYIETDEGIQGVAFVTDISGRKDIEMALRSSEEQLRQAQKMEAVGRLAGGVAHDFNNLLTVIGGRAHLLGSRIPSTDPLQQHVEIIQQTTERAAGLTNQLLVFSRHTVLQPHVLDLNAVVEAAAGILRRLLGEDIELRTVLPEDLGRVQADETQIEQVLFNLAVNARDAMPAGGRLTIETTDIEVDEGYASRHVDVSAGRYVMLMVSDTGHGMDATTQERIFEPFFTTKEAGKGTGLGLSTVYGVVKQSGGHVGVYSEVGQGTVFKIYLPRVEIAIEAPTVRPRLERATRGTETILLVEDDDEVRRLAREIVKAGGYTVLEAALPSAALALVDAAPGRIDLLLTDVVMPSMNGRALAEELVRRRPGLKVLFMSGYTADVVFQQGILESDVALLQKPFTPGTLLRAVRDVLNPGSG